MEQPDEATVCPVDKHPLEPVTAPPAPGSVQPQSQPPPLTPGNVHGLTIFPVAVVILLHFFTCGIFSLIWLNLMHGKLPKVRSDDPSAGRAVGFCFIPFYNLYWIFFSYRRLCLRLDEQRELYGLPPSNLRGMATTACVFQVIPYVNLLLGYTIVTPIFIGQMQSSVNQLVNTSATTAPKGGLPTMKAAPGTPGWAIALVICACLIIPVTAILAAMLLPALARAKHRAQAIQCMSNLKQIGLGFKLWALDNDFTFPFNVSTAKGGTLELVARLLVCVADSSKTPASNWANLKAANVSYRVHIGKDVNQSNPQEVLVVCPIHGTVLHCDGMVELKRRAR